MKVYGLSHEHESRLIRHGGIYDIVRRLDKALDSVQQSIDLAYRTNQINYPAKLELVNAPGLRIWRATAWSDVAGERVLHIYSVREFEMKMR